MITVGLLMIFTCLIPRYSSAQEKKEYTYQSIIADITVNTDSTFNVLETQTYKLNGSFGYFFRDIELKKLDHISDIQILNSEGVLLSPENYRIDHKSNIVHIQWDFPRQIFNNELKSWTIKYKVHGGLGFYQDWDELYWNAIFSDRDVSVERAEVTVHLPTPIEPNQSIKKSYIGSLGSAVENNNYKTIDNHTVQFWGDNILPDEYMTIVITWPKGVVNKPFLYRNQIMNWLFLLAAANLPISIFIHKFRRWAKEGRDIKNDRPIIAEYSPPENFPPAMVGALLRHTIDIKDITASVIDLAVRGYIKITESKKWFLSRKEYIFEKLKPEDDLRPFEQKIIEGIFGYTKNKASSKDLKNKFYTDIPKIKDLIYREFEGVDYFKNGIISARTKYAKINWYLGTLAVAGFLFLFVYRKGLDSKGILEFSIFYIIVIEISIVISLIISVIFDYYMPALSFEGTEAKRKWLGFKDYLHTAERFRLGTETIETFSKYLPYAVMFHVEKQWAKRFSDFQYQDTGWYVPLHAYHFGGIGQSTNSFEGLTSSISSFTSSISTTFSSSPSGSGAGGGAGGGGGGGGGGAG